MPPLSGMRQEPCQGARARKPGLLPHAGRSFAIPVSRRGSLLLATSTSRSRARLDGCPKAAAGGRTWGVGDPLPGSAWPCSLGFLHSTTFMGTPLDRASLSTSPALSPRDHVEMTASRLRGVESVPLALIRSPSLAWRAGDSLVRGWLGPYGLCQSSCLPALLVRASPFECRPSPRDESLGNAGGSTDALSHPPSFQRRWKTSPGCRDRAEGTSPAHSREGVNESWPRGAFHCLSPPWPKPRRGGGAGDCHPCLRPGHDWDTALPEVHGCLR